MNTLYLIPIILVLALVFAVFLAVSGVRTGGRMNPKPPEHLRPKTKCVCNLIGEQIPKDKCGTCQIKYRQNNIEVVKPQFPKESIRLSLDNANKAYDAYSKMKLEIDFRDYGQDTFDKLKKEDFEIFSAEFLETLNSSKKPNKSFVYFLLDELEKQKNKELTKPQLPKDRQGCNV